ncbi:MAG: NAD(P)-dependent oxidoreductase [Bacteroidota bacterium]|nr:NAD(P)-dependent oxidoreductase [Bacteroidota bacterium]
MKKILITGASGFIGSFLVEEALKRDYEVYAGIRKSSSTKYLSDSRIKLTELDFSNPDLLNQKISELPQFDYIIHNAGLTRAPKKADYFTSNYQYTKNIIDALISQKKVPEKFIYMSSLAAYGPGDPELLNPVQVSDTPRPLTAYGRSKLESEKYLNTLPNFPHIIIRPTAVYGPREKDLFTVFKMINNNIELFVGFKKQHLTFIYVKDLVKAVFQSMESGIINRGYFVSDGNVYDGKILGNIIKKQLGKRTLRISFPIGLVRLIAIISESTKYISGKQALLNYDKINELECTNWQCDIQPLIDELNFKPEYNLNEGIQETITWYKQTKWLK